MGKPTRSITIEFERMPHSRCNPVKIEFFRDGASIQAVVYRDVFAGKGKATCHPTDTFSWETGMRLSVKRALFSCHPIYRAFRRWMWLAKAAHECAKYVKPRDCHKCPNYDKDLVCRTLYQPVWWATPNTFIAREFGRVKVAIT